jgi:hypothetical protein
MPRPTAHPLVVYCRQHDAFETIERITCAREHDGAPCCETVASCSPSPSHAPDDVSLWPVGGFGICAACGVSVGLGGVDVRTELPHVCDPERLAHARACAAPVSCNCVFCVGRYALEGRQ